MTQIITSNTHFSVSERPNTHFFRQHFFRQKTTFKENHPEEFINHIDQSCHETNQTNLLSCWLGNPLQTGKTKTLSIQFRRKQKDLLKDFEISAEFITTSQFNRLAVKKIIFPVKVRIAASLEVFGYAESGSEVIQYTGAEIGLDYAEKYGIQKGSYFNHVYRIENTGTSSLEDVSLEIEVPVSLKNGKFLCFVEGYSLIDYYGRELNETSEFDIEALRNDRFGRNLDDLERILPKVAENSQKHQIVDKYLPTTFSYRMVSKKDMKSANNDLNGPKTDLFRSRNEDKFEGPFDQKKSL